MHPQSLAEMLYPQISQTPPPTPPPQRGEGFVVSSAERHGWG